MNINLNQRVNYKNKNDLDEPVFHRSESIGFWGHVTQLHSESLTVDIVADNGFEYFYVPVVSKEWVNDETNSGSRDLPPEGSSVFVITPTKTIQGAFVLCSGFAKTQPAESAEFVAASTSQSDIEKANNSIKKIATTGWVIEKNRENGNLSFVSNDENIFVDVVMEDDSTISIKKNITITAWNNVIKLDEDGVSITSSKDVTLKTSGDFTLDASNKNVDIQCTKFTINKTAAGTSDFSVG